MKRIWRRRVFVVCLLVAVIWWHNYIPDATVLSFRIGQSFEEVAKNSTYPVLERSNRPADDPGRNRFGVTWVTKPAVIIHFNDPRHGFKLPPTKFAALSYQDNRAVTLATSPMLEKLSFDEAVVVLEDLQNQFKSGGWILFETDGSTWFDFTPEGKKRLFAHLLERDMRTLSLYVPKKYGMTFRIWCAHGCARGKPPYLFMIDVGVGTDTYTWEPGEPKYWDKPPPATPAASSPAPDRPLRSHRSRTNSVK